MDFRKIGKKAEGVNWYMIGAIIFAVLIVLIIFILKKQAGSQAGILDWIFGVRP